MKTKRTIADIPANRVACYEWKAFDISGKGGSHPAKDAVICVSVPNHPRYQRTIATYDGEKFMLVGTQIILAGITYWCHAPATPEDLDAEEKAAKKTESAEPDLFK